MDPRADEQGLSRLGATDHQDRQTNGGAIGARRHGKSQSGFAPRVNLGPGRCRIGHEGDLLMERLWRNGENPQSLLDESGRLEAFFKEHLFLHKECTMPIEGDWISQAAAIPHKEGKLCLITSSSGKR